MTDNDGICGTERRGLHRPIKRFDQHPVPFRQGGQVQPCDGKLLDQRIAKTGAVLRAPHWQRCGKHGFVLGRQEIVGKHRRLARSSQDAREIGRRHRGKVLRVRIFHPRPVRVHIKTDTPGFSRLEHLVKAMVAVGHHPARQRQPQRLLVWRGPNAKIMTRLHHEVGGSGNASFQPGLDLGRLPRGDGSGGDVEILSALLPWDLGPTSKGRGIIGYVCYFCRRRLRKRHQQMRFRHRQTAW